METFFRYIKNNRVLIAWTLLLLVLNGCAGLGKRLESPRISLADIQVQKATFFETVFKIELRVYNTNDVPITIKGTDCRLKLQGKDFATGVSNQKTIIPALGTGIVSMTVYSSVLDVVKGLMTLPREEKLEYTLTGRVFLEGGVLMPESLSFKSEGRLTLKDFFVQ